MKMDFMFLAADFAITGAFEGETPKTKQLLQSLGFTQETLDKLESGELTLDDAKNGWLNTHETALKERIGEQIAKEKGSQAFNAVHAKNEKLVAETFGLNYDNYKETEAKGRIERMLKDVAENHKLVIEQTKSQFTGVDETKLKEVENSYIARMKEMENLHEASNQELQNQLQEQLNQNKQIIVNNYKNSARTNFLKSLESPALDYSAMEKILEFEALKYGIEIEEVNGEEVAFMTKDGVKVAHPEKPLSNLKYSDFVEIVARENNFVKKSNGGSNDKFELTAEQKESLKKRGINEKALAEREKHLAKLNGK